MSNLTAQLRVLRHRDFRYLWFAQSASVIGDCIVIVALALFVIELTGDATDLGLVFAAASLPLVAFLLIGGVWADRLPRHRVMVATDLVRFALHALLAALIFASVVHIWELIAIEALFGTAEAFFRPAANGLLPQTVPEQEIQQAQGLSALSNNIGEFAGPALATALVLGFGAGWAFALDAATFLLSAALLTRVRPRRRALSDRSAGSPEQGRRVGGAARGLCRGALAQLGVGDARGLLRRAVHRPGALVRARTAGGARAVRPHRHLRAGLGGGRRRHDRRIAARHRLAAALSDARGDARDPAVAGSGDSLRSGADALAGRPGDGDRRCRHRAVRRLVDDRAGRAHPAGQALARELL